MPRSFASISMSDVPAKNAYFFDCRNQNIPMVVVEVGKRYARLTWDCISVDRTFFEDQPEIGIEAPLVNEMFDVFQQNSKAGKALFCGSSFVGSIERLEISVAEFLADAYYRMLTIPKPLINVNA